MQKELQKEKVFKKNKRISTFYYGGLKKETPAWAFFEQRIVGKTKEQLIEFIADIINSVSEDASILTIEEECHKRGIHSRTLRKWAKQCSEFEDGKDFALEIIGIRREKGMLTKQLDSKFMVALWQFLDRYKEHDDREDKRKITLANEGVSTGEIRVITVNENIKMPKED